MNFIESIRKFRFKIECDGVQKGGFSEVSGVDLSTLVIGYGEKEPTASGQLSNQVKYIKIILRGGAIDQYIYSWVRDGIQGTIEPKSLILNAYGDEDADTTIASWTIENAWPAKYTAPDFNAAGGGIAVELLELGYESIKRTM